MLLTGATGFLGGELLRRLLERDTRPVVCLVRARTDRAARERGRATLSELLGTSRARALDGRVTWLRADLEQPQMGLHPAAFRGLVASVTEIFHCAASTQFELELEEAERINVGGTRAVLELARHARASGSLRRLHHVSTAYVVGKRSRRFEAGYLPPDRARCFRNTYERTKARAERVLRAQHEVPVTIYRPSIVVGASNDGWTRSWNTIYGPMRLAATNRLPFFPHRGGAVLDCVPVDFVSDGILALARRRDTEGRVLHLTAGDDAFSARDMLERTLERNGLHTHRIRFLRPIAWRALCWATRHLGSRFTQRVVRGTAPYAPYAQWKGRLVRTFEDELLAAENVPVPTAADWFPRVLDYALTSGFGARAKGERDTCLLRAS